MKEYNLIINGNSYSVVINEVEEPWRSRGKRTPYQVTIDKPLKKIVSAPATRAPVQLLRLQPGLRTVTRRQPPPEAPTP